MLRSIGRRRMLRTLIMAVPLAAAWLLLSHWIAQRWAVQPNLARFTVAFILFVPSVLFPSWLRAVLPDRATTQHASWLDRQRVERRTRTGRMFAVISLGVLLLLQCAAVLEPETASPAFSDGDVVVWLLLTISLSLRWRPADLGDDGAQRRTLVAANRALLVTLLACVAAILLDAYRGHGTLRPALEAALLIGCLTLQLSLIIGERQDALASERPDRTVISPAAPRRES